MLSSFVLLWLIKNCLLTSRPNFLIFHLLLSMKLPHGMGDLYAAQVVCAGFHWFLVTARAAPIYHRPYPITFNDMSESRIKKKMSPAEGVYLPEGHLILRANSRLVAGNELNHPSIVKRRLMTWIFIYIGCLQ